MKFSVVATALLAVRGDAPQARGYTFWPASSCMIEIVNFGTTNLIGGFIFGSIGFVAFAYGKRMHLWHPIFIGLALMIYPYFVNNDIVLWAAGIAGSATLWFVRN